MPIIETIGIIKKHNDRKARILIPKEFNNFEGMEAKITVELSPEQLTELRKTLSLEQLKKLNLKIKD
jgi:hypothetical protein